jgi:hypothetical protein
MRQTMRGYSFRYRDVCNSRRSGITHGDLMGRSKPSYLFVILVIGALLVVNGCSIFISTPRTARINIQDPNNTHHEYIVILDNSYNETRLDIPISDHYAVHFDFEWLWNSEFNAASAGCEVTDNDAVPPLTPWMICKYRF